MQSLISSAIVLCMSFAFVETATAATIYDFETDFSTTTNTATSTWSYRTAADLLRDGSYDLFAVSQVILSATDGWNETIANAHPPYIGVNTSGAADGVVPDGDSTVHPGHNRIAVVSWLAPSDGTAAIDYLFGDQNAGGGSGITWYIDDGDSTGNLATGLLGNGGLDQSGSIASFAVSAGDRINFVIDPVGTAPDPIPAANHAFDNTHVVATVTFVPVPEASSIALLLIGVGSVSCGWRRRRTVKY